MTRYPPMSGASLKAAIHEAATTQGRLAETLELSPKQMSWWATHEVPPGRIPDVYKALGLPLPPPLPPLSSFETIDLLKELLDRERRRSHGPVTPPENDVKQPLTDGKYSAHVETDGDEGPASGTGPKRR